MGLPEHVLEARAAAFRALPKGDGGLCAYCKADHRFGPDWWPKDEREACNAAVTKARGAAYPDLVNLTSPDLCPKCLGEASREEIHSTGQVEEIKCPRCKGAGVA